MTMAAATVDMQCHHGSCGEEASQQMPGANEDKVDLYIGRNLLQGKGLVLWNQV
jgi:hypothetical protein